MAAGFVLAAATLGLAAPAHAGGPPNGGGGGAGAAAPSHCSDADLTITNGPVESASTMRRVVVSFRNTSSNPCMLVGYPDANLVTAAGGVLVHVDQRPGLAAHVLHLARGNVANADVESYAADTTTGNACPREGTLVVTPLMTPCRTRFPSPCPFAVRPSAQWIETFPALNLRA
jgi:hypothetical protein